MEIIRVTLCNIGQRQISYYLDAIGYDIWRN